MTNIRVNTTVPYIRVTNPDATSPYVRLSNTGLQGPPGPRLVEVIYSISGIVPANRTVTLYLATANITFDPTNTLAICGTGNSVAATFNLTDLNGVAFGSVAFGAGATAGTVTLTSTSLVKGQGLKIIHPSLDIMADLIITLPANRGS